ncbi:MAG: LuxR C-terminal-related transcriptional regulator, partial [Acidimicrobiales bacterium]
ALLSRLADDLDGEAVLGEVGSGPAANLRMLDGQLTILGGMMRERLRDVDVGISRDDVAALSEALHEVHAVRFSIHDLLGHEKLRRLDELDRGLGQLRRVTDQDTLLELVSESAATACGFDRVMLSRVDDDVWRPWHSFSREIGPAEQRFLDWMRLEAPRIQLSHMLLESEVVRRREAVLVADATRDARVYRPLAEAAAQTSYVVAPLVVNDRVIGLLHADIREGEVDDLDRDILWFFANGFTQIFERAVLLARLRDQRAEVMQVLKSVESVLDDLATSEVELATRQEASVITASRPVRPIVTERSSVLEGLLTSREFEVLALMATGATNERIAQRLVIATGTVKSHVKQILRKLRVENRAEAISQYLRSTIGARED